MIYKYEISRNWNTHINNQLYPMGIWFQGIQMACLSYSNMYMYATISNNSVLQE